MAPSMVGSEGQPPQPPEEIGARIDLVSLAKQLWDIRLRLLISGLVCAVLCLGLSFLLSNEYTAKASFLPPNSSSSSTLASQLGALGGASLMGGIKTPGDVYAGILQSASVQGALVDHFNLMSVYGTRTRTAAIAKLGKRTSVDIGLKDTIVTLSVMDHDADRARDLANAYLSELENVSTRMAVTEGAQRRRFYEERLLAEKEALANAEVDLKQNEESTGLVVPTSQAQEHFESIANLRAMISNREVRLAALLQTSTDQNMDVVQLRSEIASLNAQLNTLQQGGGAGGDLATKKVPAAALEYVRKQREVRYHETMFELLARQYETARLDEAKEGPSPQVLDTAVKPELKSGPHRSLMALAAFFLGLIGAALYSIFRDRSQSWGVVRALPLLCVLCFFHPHTAHAQQKPVIYDSYITVDHWAYDALDRLHGLGYLDEASMGMRPWTRRSIGIMLGHVQESREIQRDPEAYTLFAKLLREFPVPQGEEGFHFSSPIVRYETAYSRIRGISGQTLQDSWHLGQTFSYDYGRPYQAGVNSVSGGSVMVQSGRMNLYVRGEYQSAPSGVGYSQTLVNLLHFLDTDYAPRQDTIPEGNIPVSNQFRLLEANLSYRVLRHQISIGKTDHWLSPGKGGSFAFTNNAPNNYKFQIDRTEPLYIPLLSRLTGPFRYEFFVGSLKGHTYPNDPWMHLEKFSFQPLRDVEFGFSRTVIWGGKDHAPITFGSFFNSFFDFSNVDLATKESRNDPGARFSMFNFVWRLPWLRHGLTFYCDGLVHDDLSPISAPRHAGVRPGLYLARFPGLQKMDFRVEGVNTDPQVRLSVNGEYLYVEYEQRQGYTNQGYIMGDVAGRESKGGNAWLTYHLSPSEHVQLSYRYAKAAKDFVLLGTTQHIAGLDIVKRIGPAAELSFNVQHELWKAPIYMTGQQSDNSVSGQLRWYFDAPIVAR